ncbi:acyl-CoA N-acyltransferase [Leucogyrophana mollusca]|uniref:Acyl-CoA N-acyltransferase n=1 Tax=Leucogyrophana mollusca TaxID=85980 RepID=A0ACB8BQM5_9AGAM|nr:acyl-CoA N-acyltransferase [Leucogyrophana mollusca]
MFTTDRLILREFKDGDLDSLLALRNEPSVQRGVTSQPTVPRPTKYKEFLKELAENSTIWFTIILKETGGFVGQCSIKATEPQKNRDAVFGISMFPEFWGKGYGTEATRFTVDYAFKALGVQRVSLTVLEGNPGAIAVYKKVGFQIEGRKRRANWVEGKWEDLLSMGVLDQEWAALYSKGTPS